MVQTAVKCPPNLLGRVYICADRYETMDIAGRLYHASLEQSAAFACVTGLVAKMESLFNSFSFPQAYFADRSFGVSHTDTARSSSGKKEVEQRMSEEALKEAKGEKATFVVQVQFRQNATWQGTISWTEQKKTQRFRSTLEMIKLMDEALAESTDQESTSWVSQER